MKYKVMAFKGNGIPMQMESKKHDTREQANERIKELSRVYNCVMFVAEIK